MVVYKDYSLPDGFFWKEEKAICSYDNSSMCFIAPGTFIMGCNDIFTACPEHEVFLDAYWIDRYPVTNSQFSLFVQDNGYQKKEYWSEEGFAAKESEGWKLPRYWEDKPWNQPNHPVVGISWYEAQAYCNWANKSLPTEAQWEKAARGGIYLDGDGGSVLNPYPRRKYAWGDSEPDADGLWRAVYQKEPVYGNRCSAPVGSVPIGASPYLCEDMSGNVWEWCRDWYQRDYYKNSPKSNPQGPDRGEMKVLRGGSWCRDARQIQTGFRTKDEPKSVGWDLSGFRCVLNWKGRL